MREPTRVGSVVLATLRDRQGWGRVSWTRIGPAEPEDSEEPDYTPWVRTLHLESGRYFHKNDPGSSGVGHYSWDQFEDDQELSGPVGDALTEIMQYGGYDGEHHKQHCLDQVVRILTECPTVVMVNQSAVGGPLEYEGLGENESYLAWRRRYLGDDHDGFEWSEGIAP